MHESCGIWIMPDLSTNRVCNKIKRFVWDHLIVNEKLSLQGTKSRALLGAGGYTHSNLWLIIDPCGVPHEKITVTAACFDRRRSHRNFSCLNVHVEQPCFPRWPSHAAGNGSVECWMCGNSEFLCSHLHTSLLQIIVLFTPQCFATPQRPTGLL